jgi:hypothetical protein
VRSTPEDTRMGSSVGVMVEELVWLTEQEGLSFEDAMALIKQKAAPGDYDDMIDWLKRAITFLGYA